MATAHELIGRDMPVLEEAKNRTASHHYPHGELALVVPLDADATLMGPRGWSGPGRAAPGPGSHRFLEIKGGAVFYLPAGRISSDITAPAA